MKKLYNFNGKLVSLHITRKICPVCLGVYEDNVLIDELDASADGYDRLSIIPVIEHDQWYTQFDDDLEEYILVLGQYAVSPNGTIIRPGTSVLILSGKQVKAKESSCFDDYHANGIVAITASSVKDGVTCYYGDRQDIVSGFNDILMMPMACGHCIEMGEQHLAVTVTFGDYSQTTRYWDINPITFSDHTGILGVITPHDCKYFTYNSGTWEEYRYLIDTLDYNIQTGGVISVAMHRRGIGDNYVLNRKGLNSYVCPNNLSTTNNFAKNNVEAIDTVGPVRVKRSMDAVILHKLRNGNLSDESTRLLRRRVEEVLRKNPVIMLGYAASLAAENRINVADII